MISVSFVAADQSAAAVASFAKSDNGSVAWLGLAAPEASQLSKAADAKRFDGGAGKALEITPSASDTLRMVVLGSDSDTTAAKAERLGAKAYQSLEIARATDIHSIGDSR